MIISKNFLRFTAICGFITVVTTLGIHLFFAEPPADFEERARIFLDNNYLLNRWWIIAHCILVYVAMWGFFLVQYRKSIGFVGLGLMFYSVFMIVEVARQIFVLFYLNGLRSKYITELDLAVKTLLKHDLTTYSLFSNSFFGLFILAFGIGNLCYGLSLYKENGVAKLLSWMMIIWAVVNFLSLTNEFFGNSIIEAFIGKFNFTYQPLIRGILAYWVWDSANKLK
jgi:hypothetical protein